GGLTMTTLQRSTELARADRTATSVLHTRRRLTASGVVIAVGKALAGAIAIGLALFPLAWMVIAGFKAKQEVVRTPFQFFPEVWRLENYQAILADPTFLRTLGITGLGAVLFTLLSLTVNSLAGYVFARLEFHGKRVLWVIV